jgi:hypothetical protein
VTSPTCSIPMSRIDERADRSVSSKEKSFSYHGVLP